MFSSGEKKFLDTLEVLLPPNICVFLLTFFFLCVSMGVAASVAHKQMEMILLFFVNKTQ